ncbi:hypothetical protein SAMN05421858_4998 [Haladaptatus litoreus]|uniref:DUF6199 domain-containing protein n=1 Tax=Haladaptatus litoreus TaxID=553468 RepID=A0A1N7FEL6_9EURY|nr:hypothetical protein [Haladaptatus litoreus]SIR98666.1 hypothetical protein SAMN05421858_4998 [Haladaptatus litoreus]
MIEITGLLLGGALIGLGLFGMRYAYQLTRFGEQIDAIGSKQRFSDVEPAEWNVSLSRALSLIVVLTGIVIIILALID